VVWRLLLQVKHAELFANTLAIVAGILYNAKKPIVIFLDHGGSMLGEFADSGRVFFRRGVVFGE